MLLITIMRDLVSNSNLTISYIIKLRVIIVIYLGTKKMVTTWTVMIDQKCILRFLIKLSSTNICIQKKSRLRCLPLKKVNISNIAQHNQEMIVNHCKTDQATIRSNHLSWKGVHQEPNNSSNNSMKAWVIWCLCKVDVIILFIWQEMVMYSHMVLVNYVLLGMEEQGVNLPLLF